MIKKTIILTALTLSLTSCNLNPFNSVADSVGVAGERIGKGVGYARTGKGIQFAGEGFKNLGKARIEEEKTNQAEIQAGERALELASKFIPTISDEALKIETYNKTIDKYTEINLAQEKTRQSHHQYKWYSALVIGMLLGFILLGLVQAIGKQVARIEVKPM